MLSQHPEHPQPSPWGPTTLGALLGPAHWVYEASGNVGWLHESSMNEHRTLQAWPWVGVEVPGSRLSGRGCALPRRPGVSLAQGQWSSPPCPSARWVTSILTGGLGFSPDQGQGSWSGQKPVVEEATGTAPVGTESPEPVVRQGREGERAGEHPTSELPQALLSPRWEPLGQTDPRPVDAAKPWLKSVLQMGWLPLGAQRDLERRAGSSPGSAPRCG